MRARSADYYRVMDAHEKLCDATDELERISTGHHASTQPAPLKGARIEELVRRARRQLSRMRAAALAVCNEGA